MNEFKAQRAFEQGTINFLRPSSSRNRRADESVQTVVGARLLQQPLLIALRVIGEFAVREFFQQRTRREALAGGAGEYVVELLGGRAQIELAQLRRQIRIRRIRRVRGQCCRRGDGFA